MEWFEADTWVAVDVANNILLVSRSAGSEVGNAFPDPPLMIQQFHQIHKSFLYFLSRLGLRQRKNL